MSFLSPLPGSSAPAYCDIVPLFSQSIAFNRTGAHWPNWKGLRPAFHQSHQSMAQGPRARGGMEEVCGVSFCCTYSLVISCSLYTSSLFRSIFLCLIFWCHLMAVETLCRKWVFCFPSIHFSISMQEFLLIAREKNVFIFHLFASHFWDMSCTCAFSFQVCLLNSILAGRIWKDPSL